MALVPAYTLVSQQKLESGDKQLVYDIAFGDGVLTYDTGLALAKASLGCPNALKSLVLVDPAAANGFIYKYSQSAESVRIYQGDNNNASDGPLVELGAGDTPAAASIRVQVQGW